MTAFSRRLVCGLMLCVAFALGGRPARAAHPYTGVYVIVNPYGQADLQGLRQAGATPCQATASGAPSSTFCGAADGILLRLQWCDFETDRATAGTASSCHYALGFSAGVGSAAVQLSTAGEQETATPCAQNFDVCTSSQQSTLGAALAAIQQIDGRRAAFGLAPLKLSVGLEAGKSTPNSVLGRVGFVDMPINGSADPGQEQCFRLPQSWKPAYVAAYDTAMDQLLASITARLPGANLQILKVSPIGTSDLEFGTSGVAYTTAVPGRDPMAPAAGPGGPITCSATVSGAQTWLAAYAAAPVAGQTLFQALETTFGSVLGHEQGTAANLGLAPLLSLADNGGRGVPDIDCGLTGGTACAVAPETQGNWSLYGLAVDVQDLFDNGLSGRAAAAAYAAVRHGQALGLAPSALSTVWTAIASSPIVASQSLDCALANTTPANDGALVLDGRTQSLAGVGTGLGWQTQTNLGATCGAAAHNTYATTMANAVHAGGQYIEVETDAAVTNIATCGADLAAASRALMSSVTTTCQ